MMIGMMDMECFGPDNIQKFNFICSNIKICTKSISEYLIEPISPLQLGIYLLY